MFLQVSPLVFPFYNLLLGLFFPLLKPPSNRLEIVKLFSQVTNIVIKLLAIVKLIISKFPQIVN
jgi:fumarate reductase subunit D